MAYYYVKEREDNNKRKEKEKEKKKKGEGNELEWGVFIISSRELVGNNNNEATTVSPT